MCVCVCVCACAYKCVRVCVCSELLQTAVVNFLDMVNAMGRNDSGISAGSAINIRQFDHVGKLMGRYFTNYYQLVDLDSENELTLSVPFTKSDLAGHP